MIPPSWTYVAIFCAIVPITLTLFSSFYAYRVNQKRAADDPEKKDYSPHAIWLAPITLPLLILINILVMILSTLAFAIILVLFPFALLLFRKPFLIKWILKQALKFGNELLEVNTALLRASGFYRPATA